MSNVLQKKTTQSGFSMVELMIGMGLGLLLMAGVTLLSANANRMYKVTSGAGQQIENGRFTMDLLSENLYHAGFFGNISPLINDAVDTWPTPAALSPVCETDDIDTLLTNLVNGLVVPIRGFDNQTAAPEGYTACIQDIVPDTDVLIIHRADTHTTSFEDIDNDNRLGNVYIQTGNDPKTEEPGYVIGVCTSATDCTGKRGLNNGDTVPESDSAPYDGSPATLFNLTKFDGTTADIRQYIVHIYYLRQWSATSTDNIPTLVRVELGNSGAQPAMRSNPWVEGVENMQIQYGVDDGTAPGAVNDGTPDQYIIAPDETDAAIWTNVVTARADLLVRNLQLDSSYTDEKTYYLGGSDEGIAPGGNYRRSVVSGVIRLANTGGRRECPITDEGTVPDQCL